MKHISVGNCWKSVVLGFVLLLLAGPGLQRELNLVHEAELHGFFRLQPPPDLKYFTWNRWFRGEFQEQIAARVEDHIGFRNSLFRLHNEFDYRLFRITHAEGFISGKGGNLFEEDYILEYTGRYFIGANTWNTKLNKLTAVMERLRTLGTDLILVLEPGKASFSPEFIPKRYFRVHRRVSNYTYLTTWLDTRQVPFLDLDRWFVLMKDTSHYPLYPKYGMHWSLYSVPLVLDTLSAYVASMTGRIIPTLKIQQVNVSDSLRWTDRDIADLLNLIFPLPAVEMAYPVVTTDTTVAKPSLKVLVIADSYYLNIRNDYSGKLFAEEDYWYYNSKLYPYILDDRDPVYVDKNNLQEILPRYDLILLMVSGINLHCGFWNFAEEAYRAFYPDYRDPPWSSIENRIRNDREWFRYMVKKAAENHTTLENVITRDAKYIYHTENH